MKPSRDIPSLIQLHKAKGHVYVTSWKGRLVVKAWPRARGTPKSATTREQMAVFAVSQALAKLSLPEDVQISEAETKGTGWYPRDMRTAAMYGTLFEVRYLY